MSRVCLFCPNRAGTLEDVSPLWVIKSVGADSVSPTEFWNAVDAPPHRWAGAKFKTRKLCRECNNGWMSNLETAVRPTMGGLINDLAMELDAEQQPEAMHGSLRLRMMSGPWTRSSCKSGLLRSRGSVGLLPRASPNSMTSYGI